MMVSLAVFNLSYESIENSAGGVMVWLVGGFPLLGALLGGVFLSRQQRQAIYTLTLLAAILSFIASVFIFIEYMNAGFISRVYHGYSWMSISGIKVDSSLYLDRISSVMMLAITSLSLLVHFFARNYLHQVQSASFYFFLNLAQGLMVYLVLAENLIFMFVAWFGVSVIASLVLAQNIKQIKNNMWRQVFVVDRLGDVGFLVGALFVYFFFKSVSFSEMQESITALDVKSIATDKMYSFMALSFVFSIAAKSGLVPFHVWVPKKIEIPTPGIILLYSLIGMIAGTYLMFRMHPYFFLSSIAMSTLLWLGVLTALLASVIAMVQVKVKYILSYLAISQLGVVVALFGVGAFSLSFYYLIVQLSLIALFYMVSGIVSQSTRGEQDIFEMGGLKKYMPISHALMFFGVAAFIGFPGLAGYFAEFDAMTIFAGRGGWILFIAFSLIKMMMAFYAARLLFLMFNGVYRGSKEKRNSLKEGSSSMIIPSLGVALVILIFGFLDLPRFVGGVNIFMDFVNDELFIPLSVQNYWVFEGQGVTSLTESNLKFIFNLLTFFSFFLSFYLYGKGPRPVTVGFMNQFKKLYLYLLDQCGVERVYKKNIISPFRDMSDFLLQIVENRMINGVAGVLGSSVATFSSIVSLKTSDRTSIHKELCIVGVLVLMTWMIF